MTEETPTSSSPSRIEPPPPARKMDALPILYLVGFLILAAALVYLWQNPTMPRTAALESGRIDTLRQQVETLTARVAQIEGRPAPSAATAPANLAPLEARVAELERRPPAPNLAPIEQRIAAFEARPLPQPTDLGPVNQKIDGIARQGADGLAGLAKRLDAIEARLATTETQTKDAASGIGAASARSERAVRLAAASAALENGQKLGAIPGAAPALARFADTAPPTLAQLRLSFDAAADAAREASRPEQAEGKDLLGRAWARAQQLVTVRQGEKVIVGDPMAGVLERARALLEAGDLASAITTLDTGLLPAAKAAMQGWIDQAKALLAARSALGELAARG